MLTVSKTSFYIFFGFPVVAIFARLNPITAEFSYLLIAVYALLGERQLIQSLLLSFIFTMINPTIAPSVEYQSLLRYLVIYFSFLSIFLRRSFFKLNGLLFFTIILGFLIIIHSSFFSQFADVSIFKVISWTVVMITLLKAWSGLNELDHKQMLNWIQKVLVFILVLSIPTIFIPEVGYARNKGFFQGVLSHPQVFGIVVAILVILIFAKIIEKRKPELNLIFVLFFSLIFLYLSGSRTAGLALILTISLNIIVYLIYGLFKNKNFLFTIKSKRAFFIYFLSIIILLLFYENFSILVSSFLQKGTVNTKSIFTIYFESRGVLFEPMLNNIDKNFFTGIGFGIGSNITEFYIQRDPFFNLPISAPIEKGLLPLMIFEELGIFGFILFFVWFCILISKAFKKSLQASFFLIFIILVNLGEAILFSPGGLGLLMLILLTSVVTKPGTSSNSVVLTYSKK